MNSFGSTIGGHGNPYMHSQNSLSETGPALRPMRNPAMKLAAPLGKNRLNGGRGARRSLAPQRAALGGTDPNALGLPGAGITDYSG